MHRFGRFTIMKTTSCCRPAQVTALLLSLCAVAGGQTPPDLTSGFDADTAHWRASDGGATLVWQAIDGNPAGHLRALGPGGVWWLVSPVAWAGDWSDYRTLKFDLAIPSGHYPSSDTAGMVVIAGTNGMTMTWTGPTPLWTWTYYEVSLDADSFGVDQATFDGIMASVSELRILAEFVGGTETVGLDNVLVTATPPTVFITDLRTTFTSGTKEGWSVVDDANLSLKDEGRPSWSLFGNDIQAGQNFKVTSPVGWAGDWRNFTEIRFDLKWSSTSANQPATAMLTLFGAGGDVVTWHGVPARDAWQHYAVPLTPEAFGVEAARFERILRHVSKIWLHGEFNAGDDTTWFDNITVATGPHTPVVYSTSLGSRFGLDDEGWVAYDNAAFSYDPTGGFLGSGAAKVVDNGAGTARFQSPDAWAGDWRAFAALRFMVHQTTSSDYNASIWIADFSGNVIQQVFTPPLRMWTPYTVDLTPAAFGVTPEVFDAVMGDVACLWINANLGGNGVTWLDEVSLLPSAAAGTPPPDRGAQFAADAEGWTRGNLNSEVWAAPAAVHYYYDGADHPPSCVVNADGGTGATMFYSPEAWTGDWRGFQSLAFDMQVVQGSQSNLIDPGAMIWLVSAHGSLVANCTEVPPIGAWRRYEFALNPVAFGVTAADYDRIARDVVMLAIRSEWLSGTAEREALDNVALSSTPTPYWAWLDDYLDPLELLDPALAATAADADRDHRTNWDEFLAITTPTDPLSRFVVTAASGPGGLVVAYPSRSGRVYQVWKSLDLSGPASWTAVGPAVPGDDALKTHIDAAAEPAAFFRVGIALP
jgi:hypothetical protein